MKVTVLISLLLQVVSIQYVRCQGSGGPSTFGYDAASACSKPYSRSGRARLVNLPCDFRRQNWCTVAGSAYPWHAVRRFVQENRGLMKRMYGDERHINVLRAEFEKNNIELSYEDYYHHITEDHRRFQYIDDYDYTEGDHEEAKSNGEEYEGRGFTSRSFNDPTTKRSNKFPKLSEYTRPHFRPTDKSTTTTTTKASTTTTSTTNPTTSQSPQTTASTTIAAQPDSTSDSSPTKLASSSTSPRTTVSLEETENEGTEERMTEPVAITVSSIPQEQNSSINEITGQIDRIDESVEEDIETPSVLDALEETAATVTTPGTTGIPVEVETEEDEAFEFAKETTIRESIASVEQQFRPRPEYRPSGRPEASTMEGQLYQDVAAKDQQEQPVLKLRGVNACPVKEEVVAPFWANNTRGEVLALLNLYPFEQYVHWEKCTHENKQMYCRDGCRCEQQYRLHRLLAYDPNNECRGIFSDWFKFPSCCVCRCYDLPLEFRVTSRSPRTQKQKIKVRQPRSRYT